jgi:3-deoxy-D-manno-octulosonate 8-phosphate phosphatase (KDO 8-P phosphatase)
MNPLLTKKRRTLQVNSRRLSSGVIRRIKSIEVLLMDVDGVMTDGGIFFNNTGTEMKRFDIQDGMGIDMAVRGGLTVGIITGRKSESVLRRALELGMSIIKQGYYDKTIALEECLKEHKISSDKIGYIGDDILDLAVLNKVAFRAAPNNAVPEVKKAVDYVCHASGGHGAVREVVDLVLEVRGVRSSLLKDYINHPLPNVKLKDSS